MAESTMEDRRVTGDLDMPFDPMNETCARHGIAALTKEALQFGRYALISAGSNFGANCFDLACQLRNISASAESCYPEIFGKTGSYL